jgi:cathepsin L
MSAQYKLKYGTLINLSNQEINDCTADWGNYGCNGGIMDNVYRYAWDVSGVSKESDYPYFGIDVKKQTIDNIFNNQYFFLFFL